MSGRKNNKNKKRYLVRVCLVLSTLLLLMFGCSKHAINPIHTLTNNEFPRKFIADSKPACEIQHLTFDGKPFILVYTKTGSGGYLSYALYEYDGVGKLQEVFSEKDLFQGEIYLGANCLYRSTSCKVFKLTYDNGKFNLTEYKQRLKADPDAGTNVITYDWDEKEGFIVTFNHQKVVFDKSDESSFCSSNAYKVKTDDVIYIDDNMVGKEPQGIRTLVSNDDFNSIQGLFKGFRPARLGILEFSISVNYGNWYHLRINAVEPQE